MLTRTIKRYKTSEFMRTQASQDTTVSKKEEFCVGHRPHKADLPFRQSSSK